jgi:hypothetical protein
LPPVPLMIDLGSSAALMLSSAYQRAAEVGFSGRRSARFRRHDDQQDAGFGCDLADVGEDQRIFGLSDE